MPRLVGRSLDSMSVLMGPLALNGVESFLCFFRVAETFQRRVSMERHDHAQAFPWLVNNRADYFKNATYCNKHDHKSQVAIRADHVPPSGVLDPFFPLFSPNPVNGSCRRCFLGEEGSADHQHRVIQKVDIDARRGFYRIHISARSICDHRQLPYCHNWSPDATDRFYPASTHSSSTFAGAPCEGSKASLIAALSV